MTRSLWLLILVVMLSACAGDVSVQIEASPSPSTSSSPSPQATPSPAQFSPSPEITPSGPPGNAVLVDLLRDAAKYTITVVAADGHIVQQLSARQRTPIAVASGHAITLSYVSTTTTSLYYLDGDSTVQMWRHDGTTARVGVLDVKIGMEAAMAVSPDDKRIAVSVLDFNRTPVHLTLYTDALAGGSKRIIYESDKNYVWPVAWRGGLLVLAHAFGPFEEDISKAAPGRDNPYSAISYHVVDPANANRVVLMGSCTVSGPLSPAGSGCIQGGSIDWQGNTEPWSTRDWGTVSSAAALSPNGEWMMATSPDNPYAMALWARNGNSPTFLKGPGGRDWVGWLDNETIITGSYTDPQWQPEVNNIVRGGIEHFVVDAHGFFAALLPTNVT